MTVIGSGGRFKLIIGGCNVDDYSVCVCVRKYIYVVCKREEAAASSFTRSDQWETRATRASIKESIGDVCMCVEVESGRLNGRVKDPCAWCAMLSDAIGWSAMDDAGEQCKMVRTIHSGRRDMRRICIAYDACVGLVHTALRSPHSSMTDRRTATTRPWETPAIRRTRGRCARGAQQGRKSSVTSQQREGRPIKLNVADNPQR